jgi:hypothetical protein
MNQNHKFFLSLLDEAVAFEDAPGECLEEVWDRCLEIIHEAGDRAARLGLPQLVEKSRQFRQWATPGKAKAFLAECLAALPTTTAQPDKMLSLREAAALIGYTEKGLRKIVDRSKQNGQSTKGPTIEFFQTGKGGPIRFKREWVEAFIEASKTTPAARLPTVRRIKPGKSHGLRYDLLSQ